MTTTKFIDKEIEDDFAKEFEGKLFVDINMFKFGKTFSITKDFYTVKNGKVYMVNDGREDPTDDSMINLSMDCKKIGIYHTEKIYKRIIKDYTYAEFKKMHKL